MKRADGIDGYYQNYSCAFLSEVQEQPKMSIDLIAAKVTKQRFFLLLCFMAIGLVIALLQWDSSRLVLEAPNSSDVESSYVSPEFSVEEFAKLKFGCEDRPTVSRKVMAYSLFGISNDTGIIERFFTPLKTNLELANFYYPGMEVRVYHDLQARSLLVGLPSFVRLCSIVSIPISEPNVLNARYGNLSWINPRVWRFLPLLEPEVDVFLSRDVDSLLLEREVAAVDEWLQLNRTFHVMRDHPQHNTWILAGMWGAKLDRKRDAIRLSAIQILLNSQNLEKSTDQKLLAEFVWPIAQDDVVIHDAFLCRDPRLRGRFSIIRPFPTQRSNFTFVGNVVTLAPQVKEECPVECRPDDHKEWTHC